MRKYKPARRDLRRDQERKYGTVANAFTAGNTLETPNADFDPRPLSGGTAGHLAP